MAQAVAGQEQSIARGSHGNAKRPIRLDAEPDLPREP